MPLSESEVEDLAIDILKSLGYAHLSPELQEEERADLSEVILKQRLKAAIDRLNAKLPEDTREQALKMVLSLPFQDLLANNETFHRYLTDGIPVEYRHNGDVKGDKVWLVDFENSSENDFVVCDQFTVTQGNNHKRPDLVLFVNGLPLVVIELKNPEDEQATVKKAYTQLENYKVAIEALFQYNSLLVASDGHDAKAGSLTSDWARFMAWKTVDGKKEESKTTPQLVTLLNGMMAPDILMDLIKQFTVFEKTKKEDPVTHLTSVETVKKLAAYHQYHAVNKALKSTRKAASEKGDRKAGVVWHTQGSGKSLSMVFYAGKIVLGLDNPTIVVMTDRNDLDNQLFDTFAACKQLLRQEPVQALDRGHLQKLLKTAGGGIIFTTIQKFFPEDGAESLDELSNRKNIIVIADEAHRSQYGFGAKTRIRDDQAFTSYGFAKYLRDALPNASFIGFTGTPIEKEDASTPAVFGNYIDVYDIQQAVADGATVRIYYESRLAKVHLKAEAKQQLDAEVESLTEGEETTASEKAKAKWAQLEAIVGHPDRMKTIARDIVDHFEQRQIALNGKAMIVTMSRRIAVALYEEIIKLKPEWQDDDLGKGALKVVMTSSSSDPGNWQRHHTTKQARRSLAERFKNAQDPLKLVIVRDMWLTGFDAPCLKTLYIDKPMQGHNLMQAIARVNRVYGEVEGGLIVDYIGIATDLKKALAVYTESGGKGEPTLDQSEAVAMMLEKYEVVIGLLESFDFRRYFKANTSEKMTIILEAQEHILGLEKGKDRFTKEVMSLSKAFALSVPNLKALEIKDEVGFFQAVKARLTKFEPEGGGRSDTDIETAIRQIVDKAVVSEGIIDIFDAAGIKKPDISILSDDFLAEIQGMKHKNVAFELLQKLLNDEIKTRAQRNFIQSKKLSEMLENAIRRYHNNLLTTAQIIEELIELGKKIREEDKRGEKLQMNFQELAFYDALANNESAREVLGDEKLRDLSRVLVERVKGNTSIDWTIKESVQAKLRVIVKRTLAKFGYPPDQQKLATENILKQAKLIMEEGSDSP